MSGEFIEISDDWDIEVVNKKMFLEFSPNPVAKGDTALIHRNLLYANGVEKQLPIDKRIPYASVHPDSRSYGTLRDIAAGETGNYLYGVTGGFQFVTRDDIAQDKVEAQMVASSYVDKEMPTSELSTLSNQSLSDSQSNFDDLSAEEKRIMDQRYWESLEAGNVDTSGSDTPKLMESSDIGIMTHNSDQDYIYGSGSLIIGKELEPCEPYYPENQIFERRVDNNDGCDSDDLGSTRVVAKSIETDFRYCFSTDRDKWEGQLESLKQKINYGICFKSAEDLNLIEINSAQDPDITEKSYCDIKKRMLQLHDSLEENRMQYTGESITVWSPKAILEHEKVHVEQYKNEVFEELVLKEGGLVNKLQTTEYSLAKEQATNTNEAKQKLGGKLDELKEIYFAELREYKKENWVRWQLEAEEPEEEVYAELIGAIQERAEQENWKPCNE